MWQSFWSLGQLNNFNQKINVNYSLPLRKIKPLDWIKLTTRYSANYEWMNAPPASKSLGNTIQNSRSIAYNGNFNFVSLYNKVPFLKKINNPPRKKQLSKDLDDDLPEDQKQSKDEQSTTARALFKMLMMLKQAQFDVAYTDGTTLPG
ncbi:hypothetical protein OAP11_01270, partial [Bacteroidia bacterium]|nr:hypothetical protein [Bacteroidia bacterium]